MTGRGDSRRRLLGIAMRLAAATCFALMAAIIKLASEAGTGTVELVFYRFAFSFIPLLAWIAARREWDAWRTERPGAHVGRAMLGLATMALTFGALVWLPLAEATTIAFAAPLLSVVLSAAILREPVGRYRWGAVAAGLIGVAIVMRPGGSHAPLAPIGLALAIAGALGSAGVTITLRQIGRTEGMTTVVLWFTSLSCAATALLMPFYGRGHNLPGWLLLAAIGILGGIGQLFMTASLRHAPVSAVVPFDYVQIVWAVLFGWLLWRTEPAASTLVGATVIVASGLFTLYREHRLGRERERPTPVGG
jgi:drug/metabolite transporter (DMT)-like permease